MVKGWMAMAYSMRHHNERYGGVFKDQMAEFAANAIKSPEKMAAEQFAHLKQMLIFAEENIPFYRQCFREFGFKPDAFDTLDQFRKLPLLDKETVRERGQDLMANLGRIKMIETHTSGTTGKALQLHISQEAWQRHIACLWFHFSWAGVHRGDRIVTLAGHPVTAIESMKPPFWIYDRFENEVLFSSQHITSSTLPHYANALAKFNPALIRGYPSSVYLISLYLLEAGRKDIRPKAVFTSSETLLDFQREVIEEAFGCKVYSYYSNTECVAHIMQCQAGNFHVATETCFVEILNPEGQPAKAGETGELICTGLIDRVMPFIRYKTGDTALATDVLCTCGRNTPIIGDLTGRVDDVLITPDGRHVGRVGHVFKDTLRVKEAQIIQREIDSIIVKIVPRKGFCAEDEKKILDGLNLRLGHEVKVSIQIVESIPRLANGKFRFVISEVPIQIGRSPQKHPAPPSY